MCASVLVHVSVSVIVPADSVSAQLLRTPCRHALYRILPLAACAPQHNVPQAGHLHAITRLSWLLNAHLRTASGWMAELLQHPQQLEDLKKEPNQVSPWLQGCCATMSP